MPRILVHYVSMGAPALIKARPWAANGKFNIPPQRMQRIKASSRLRAALSLGGLELSLGGLEYICKRLLLLFALSLKCSSLSLPSPRLVSLLALKTREQTFAE